MFALFSRTEEVKLCVSYLDDLLLLNLGRCGGADVLTFAVLPDLRT